MRIEHFLKKCLPIPLFNKYSNNLMIQLGVVCADDLKYAIPQIGDK